VSGNQNGSQTEIVIETEEDASLERCLSALFAFSTLQRLEFRLAERETLNPELVSRCVSLSMESGVLCSQTALVGFSDAAYTGEFRRKVRPPMFMGFLARGCPKTGNDSDDEWDAKAANPADASRSSLFAQVIEQQDTGGWWTAPDRLLALVSGRVPEIPELKGHAKAVEVTATVIAISILRKKCGEHKATWRLIERKGLQWLRGQGIEAERLIGEMMGRLAE
jgi:hypothetical protein